MSLTREIKDFALDAGFCVVGITTADDFSAYVEEVKSRGDRYDWVLASPTSPVAASKPRTMMPTAKSIIVLAWDYAQKAFPASLLDKVARIYQARCYMPSPHRINGARLEIVKDFLRGRGCEVSSAINVPARWAGARAGATTFGRNTFAYANSVGSFIVLYSLVIDRELEYDAPTMDCKCPDGCTACIDACPTGAIYAPFKLEPRRCIAFNCWMTTEGRGCGIPTYIPHEVRDRMGTRVHGCDLCQEVCPRNAAKMKARFPKDQFLEEVARDFSLPAMLRMSDEFFASRVQPIMYNYIKEPKYFQRNAAVALGNTGDRAFVPDLAAALESPEELVRAHAAWALGKLGGAEARHALGSLRACETSEKVREEIDAALERLA